MPLEQCKKKACWLITGVVIEACPLSIREYFFFILGNPIHQPTQLEWDVQPIVFHRRSDVPTIHQQGRFGKMPAVMVLYMSMFCSPTESVIDHVWHIIVHIAAERNHALKHVFPG